MPREVAAVAAVSLQRSERGRWLLAIVLLLFLAGCSSRPPAPKPFLVLDDKGIALGEKRMAWTELQHLSEVTMPAPEGPFTQLVASDKAGQSLVLCASFTAPPTPGSTVATLAGEVGISDDQLENVREAVCDAAGFEMLETSPTGPIYGRVKDGPKPRPPAQPLEFAR